VPPPYKGQDLDIDWSNGLNGLDRLNELQDLAQWAGGVFGSTSSMAQWAQRAHRLDGLPDLRVQRLDGRDFATALATKPTAKPIVALPPYEGQDPDIDRCNKLDKLNRLDKLRGGSAQRAQRVFGSMSSTAQRSHQACRLDSLLDSGV
jgi:hypothetical protein